MKEASHRHNMKALLFYAAIVFGFMGIMHGAFAEAGIKSNLIYGTWTAIEYGGTTSPSADTVTILKFHTNGIYLWYRATQETNISLFTGAFKLAGPRLTLQPGHGYGANRKPVVFEPLFYTNGFLVVHEEKTRAWMKLDKTEDDWFDSSHDRLAFCGISSNRELSCAVYCVSNMDESIRQPSGIVADGITQLILDKTGPEKTNVWLVLLTQKPGPAEYSGYIYQKPSTLRSNYCSGSVNDMWGHTNLYCQVYLPGKKEWDDKPQGVVMSFFVSIKAVSMEDVAAVINAFYRDHGVDENTNMNKIPICHVEEVATNIISVEFLKKASGGGPCIRYRQTNGFWTAITSEWRYWSGNRYWP